MKADLRTMKSMLKKISVLGIEEARMTIGDGKLHGGYVDPAHVAMLDMTMKLKDCKNAPVDFAMDLTTLQSRIYHLPVGNIKKDDPENILKIKMKIVQGKVESFKFYHPMLTFQKAVKDIAGIPESKLPKGIVEGVKATANINTRQFKIFLKIADEENDHISLIAEQKENILRAEFITDEMEEIYTDLTYSLGGIEGIDLKFANKKVGRVKALFSTDYMINIINLINAPIIKIGLNNDCPIVVWWNEGDILSGLYLLAPRIESE